MRVPTRFECPSSKDGAINDCECVLDCSGIPPSSAPSLGSVLNDDNFARLYLNAFAADRMVVVVLLVLVRCQAGTPVSSETCRMPFPNILTLTRIFPAGIQVMLWT